MNGVDESVQRFVEGIDHPERRRDAETLLEMMSRVTGEKARLYGNIIGFGHYHYKYTSGRESDAAAAAFSPRKAAISLYVPDGVGSHTELLHRLGPHTSGVGCVYLKDLEAIDLKVLETIVARSYATLSAGTYGLRAR
ncbi:MAG TPA: DUF1801 domain-containing protein [Acidimicrobiia bacterium]|nr:DUF1801 domain-containing protein [Acidimicrobiia bacterium]